MSDSASRRAALLALAIVSLIWSYNWIVIKVVLHYVGPMTFSAQRYVLGTVVVFALLALRRESLKPTPWRETLWIGLTQSAGFQALIQLAVVHGGAGKSAMLTYTMPFWVIPLAWLMLGDRPSRREWAFISLAALGLIFVIEPWHGVGGLASALLAVGAGVCWALGTVLSKRLFMRHASITPLRLTAWQMLYGTVVLVVVAVFVHERAVQWTWPMLGALAYNGVLATGIAWVLWLFVVQRLSANISGLASLATPLLGVAFAWAILGEVPDAAEATGIVLMIIALFGVLRPRPTRAADTATSN